MRVLLLALFLGFFSAPAEQAPATQAASEQCASCPAFSSLFSPLADTVNGIVFYYSGPSTGASVNGTSEFLLGNGTRITLRVGDEICLEINGQWCCYIVA